MMHDHAIIEKHSPYHYMSIEHEKKALPIAYVALAGSAKTNGQKGKLVSATYAERQSHSATIPQEYNEVGSIKLQALNASVKVWDMTIYYKNGRTQTVPSPGIIYLNNESPFIDLEEEGGVKMITFSLNAVTFTHNAPVVWIWGR